MRIFRLAAAAALCLFCGPAWAVDGVIEINQARALKGGVTAGDAPGFPVTIDAAGSYRLTGNLTLPDGLSGILVNAGNVAIDLNGFTIQGSNVCTQGANRQVACSAPTGAQYGVNAGGRTSVTVRNGKIRGMDFSCLLASGGSALIENVQVSHCSVGAFVGSGGVARRMTATLCDQTGLNILSGAVVSDVTSFRNGGAGISLSSSSTVERALLFENGGNGLSAGDGVSVFQAIARGNEGSGFSGVALLVDSLAIHNAGVGLDNVRLGRGNAAYDNQGGDGTIDVQLGPNQCGAAPCP